MDERWAGVLAALRACALADEMAVRWDDWWVVVKVAVMESPRVSS